MSFTYASPNVFPQSVPTLFSSSFPGGFGITMPSLNLNPQAYGASSQGYGNLLNNAQPPSPLNADADGTLGARENTEGGAPGSLGNALPQQSFVFYPIPDNHFVFYPESMPTEDDFDGAGNVISGNNAASLDDIKDAQPKMRDTKMKSKKKTPARGNWKGCC